MQNSTNSKSILTSPAWSCVYVGNTCKSLTSYIGFSLALLCFAGWSPHLVLTTPTCRPPHIMQHTTQIHSFHVIDSCPAPGGGIPPLRHDLCSRSCSYRLIGLYQFSHLWKVNKGLWWLGSRTYFGLFTWVRQGVEGQFYAPCC